MTAAMRAGRVERDAIIAHIDAAFVKEYLAEEERERRVDEAAKAVHVHQLDAIVADLPSMPVLLGKAKVPGKANRMLGGVKRWPDFYPFYWAAATVSLIIAFVPWIATIAAFKGHLPTWAVVIDVFTIVFGVIGVIASIVGGLRLVDIRDRRRKGL